MNIIEKIINAGFKEQGQKSLLNLMPHKEKWIPDWWNNYPFNQHWLGLSIDHPDAWFRKEGLDKEAIISLNGILMPDNNDYRVLMNNRACRYICLKDGDKIVYETYTGVQPEGVIVESFLKN